MNYELEPEALTHAIIIWQNKSPRNAQLQVTSPQLRITEKSRLGKFLYHGACIKIY